MNTTLKLFINPFERYSEKMLLALGIPALLLGTFLGVHFDARFDGVLDMHFVKSASFQTVFLDSVLSVLSIFILLFAWAKFINLKTRFIDILNTVLVARIASYLLVFAPKPSDELIKNTAMGDFSAISTLDISLLLIGSIFALLLLVWHITLLYQGFKVASNAKKAQDSIGFALCIILGEVLSKFLISFLN